MSEDNKTIVSKPLSIGFSFSKTKQKTTLIQTETVKLFKQDDSKKKSNNENDQPELITSIEGTKVKPLNGTSKQDNKPLVIPCQKNQLLIKSKKDTKDDNTDSFKIDPKANPDDVEAVKALIQDSLKRKNTEKEEDNIAISLNENGVEEIEAVEDPNYEAVDLEKFGLAALRGMGWSEKKGIGKTNKRPSAVYEPELRPKGLGLGAGFSSKKIKTDDRNDSSRQDNLSYVKGACVEILYGKHSAQVGQIASFDDSLGRVLVKLAKNDDLISILQDHTKLLSKKDYQKVLDRLKIR